MQIANAAKRQARKGISRRTALAAGAACLFAPSVLRAQTGIRIGVVHPQSGPFGSVGALARKAVHLAWESAGGEATGIQLVDIDLGADPSTVQEVIDANAREGISALIGGVSSNFAMAVALAAKPHGIPFMVDSAGADSFLGEAFPRVFRFSPGFHQLVLEGVVTIGAINTEHGHPASRVQIVHAARGYGQTAGPRVSDRFDESGLQVLPDMEMRSASVADTLAETIRHAQPDILVPLMGRNLMTALLEAVEREGIPLKAIISILGIADQEAVYSNSPGFELLFDAGHGFSTALPDGQRLREEIATAGLPVRPAVYLAVNAARCLFDAVARAASADPGEITGAIRASSYQAPAMPYQATQFVRGQNYGARGVLWQVQNGRLAIIAPNAQATAEPVYPRPV